MPLTSDEQILATAGDIVKQLHAIFGAHPGFRPAHAKGIILTGTFTPSPKASSYTKAPHFNSASTPVWARFSNSTGLPNVPDSDPNASPRGIGLRFQLGDRKHTDIVAHSTPFFPAQDGQQFLDLFKAIAATTPDSAHPTPIEAFLGAHPAALAFVTAPKPTPVSYATDRYWAVNAYKLISSEGKETFVRWSVVPEAGIVPYDAETLKDADADFLHKELPGRLAQGPVVFKVVAQIAEEGDVITDSTVHWPAERKVVEFGTVKLESILEGHEKESKYAIFDPIPRVEGIEPSDDPLLEMRAAVYLLSGRERRAA